MKLLLNVVIVRPDDFLESRGQSGISLYGADEIIPDSWIIAGEVELDLDVDMQDISTIVVGCLNKQIAEENEAFSAKIFMLERKIRELTALPAPEKYYQPEQSQDEIHAEENRVFDA